MLTKNEEVIKIAKEIKNLGPNLKYWKEIVEELNESKKYTKHNQTKLPYILSEILLKHQLKDISQILGIEDLIEFNPIEDGEKSQNYTFLNDYGNITAINSEKEVYSELDEIVLINGLPTVFEIKLQNGQRGQERINKSITKEKLIHRLDPVTEYFNTDKLAYVLVTFPEKISNKHKDQLNFKRRNGLIAPFYTSNKKYLKETKKIAKRFRIEG